MSFAKTYISLVCCLAGVLSSHSAVAQVSTSTSSSEEEIVIVWEDEINTSSTSDTISVGEVPELSDINARARFEVSATGGIDTSFEKPGEQILFFGVSGLVELDVELSRSLSIFAQPKFYHATTWNRSLDDRQMLYLNTPEAYVRYRDSFVSLKIGALVHKWGSSDLIAPSDVLNPQDLRLGLINGNKIPTLGAQVEAQLGPLTLTAVVQPFFAASRYHLVGWDYAILQPNKFMGNPTRTLEAVYGPGTLDRIGDEMVATERPQDSLDNGTYALRGLVELGDLSLAMSFVHGWDSIPTMVVNEDLLTVANAVWQEVEQRRFRPVGISDEVDAALVRLQDAVEAGRPLFNGRFQRRTLLGIDANYVLDPVILKLDVAYTFKRTFYTEGPLATRHPWLNAAFGFEYVRGQEFQLLVEGYFSAVLDVPERELLIFLESTGSSREQGRIVPIYGISAVMRYMIIEEELGLEAAAIYNIGQGDVLLAPALFWRLDDQQQLRASLVLIEGSEDSYGDTFSHNDQVLVTYKYAY